MRIELPEMEGAFPRTGSGSGYTGDLSRATEEIGERIIEHYADRFNDLILRYVRGEDVYERLRFSGL